MARTADPLADYNAKRDFGRTAEPAGKRVSSQGGNRFVVQKHDATRLHWDFRLEMDGVLKSWAVTKGPSLNPDDKRLAVRTEDHPLDYAMFEGVIPAGEYGGGTVMLWDQGTWAPIDGKSAEDLEKGHLHFRLEGQRMKGEWLLVRMRPRPGEKRENWLLRKIDDSYAGGSDDLVDHCLTSVLTGRSMAEIAADPQAEHALSGKSRQAFAREMAAAERHNNRLAGVAPSRRTRGKLPRFRSLQLATLVDTVPAGNDWMHEIKFDGYRALIAANGRDVRVYTRTGLDWTDKFGPLVEAIAALDLPSCLIDGEITSPDGNGNPSFSTLQEALKRERQPSDLRLDFHAFDLLELDGEDLTGEAAIERKYRLDALLRQAKPPIHVADYVIGAGEKLLKAMCAAGQEGIISKRVDAPYRGRRTHGWVKVKCTRRQEFVIIGWKPSRSKLRPFASLLLAQYEGDRLVYRGMVGTGFNEGMLADLSAQLDPLSIGKAPCDVDRTEARHVHWVRPELVAEVAFAEFTAEGRVRHASFISLRADKPARSVVREEPQPMPTTASRVTITHPDRTIFPESGQTKGQLADYYSAIAAPLLVHGGNRPISLVRCPEGTAKQCFFQKHDSGGFGPDVHHVPIREKDGGTEDYLYIDSAAGLLECVQMGTIEFHGWACHADAVERPDRMVFDLDPDTGIGFPDVRKAAFELRKQLAELGLTSFAMLTGGKGIHVSVPLTPGHDWDTHRDFAKRFAEAMSQAEPDRFVATMSKARRKERIFIDWLRNQRGGTAVVPYSARARTGAPVAAPVAWDELDAIDRAARWSIDDVEELLQRASDAPLKGWGMATQKLPKI